MSDKPDNPSDAQVPASPEYRVRRPESETSAPKSAQNTAASAVPPHATRESRQADAASGSEGADEKPTEIGGPTGLEPTRFGDWERDGRCVDF